MQELKYNELENRASESSERDQVKQLEARSRVLREIENMKAAGEALVLSEEEQNMLQSFRRFKLRMRRDGEVFNWQTRRAEGVVIAQDTAEIVSPSEFSARERETIEMLNHAILNPGVEPR